MDKAEGRVKEAYGALIGDEEKKAEGRAQQRKAKAEEEAEQREKARQAEAAEKERDRQRLKDKGIVGDLTDNLTGR
jgi:uncharacterized protein YjbJ (UPF0337 family)